MDDNALDPKESAPEVKVVEFFIQILQSEIIEALENQAKWQALWRVKVPATCFRETQDVKYFCLNGFKDISSQEEAEAVNKKLIQLEQVIPQIHIMPSTSGIPGKIKKEIFKNRATRRHIKN